MENSTTIDLSHVAKTLELREEQVQTAVKLLEDGNTIPFITRYRKDETGNLGERQLRSIKQEVARLGGLAERKTIILKSLENQGRLTDSLQKQIEQANQSRQLEEIYLPFKPKKTSLAETARQQGLEPLARDILEGLRPDIDLASRATDFVRVDKGLNSIDEVIRGVRHIVAERFSEHIRLRKRIRKLYWESGKLQTELVEPAATPSAPAPSKPQPEPQPAARPGENAVSGDAAETPTETPAPPLADGGSGDTPPATGDPGSQTTGTPAAESTAEVSPPASGPQAEPVEATIQGSEQSASQTTSAEVAPPPATTEPASASDADIAVADVAVADVANAEAANPEVANPEVTTPGVVETGVAATETVQAVALPAAPSPETASEQTPETSPPPAAAAKPRKKRKKKKKKKTRPDPFAEFSNFEEGLQKLPPHRTLAINRGERAGKLKVRLQCDPEKLNEIARECLVPQDHPLAEFLITACDDAMNRLILPGVEREIRRDLTERAETHAVKVFARNLRHLFLQPPVRGKRIMGIDPGYRSGCKVAVIDEMGQPVGHGVFSIVGNQERIQNNRKRLIDLINQHQPDLISIGNGSGCRAVEQFVSDVISGELADRNLQYSIVNQAGTSAYSTSEVGQSDLPNHDPVIRSAISIARRLQDPLSELVKVNPANIGVGMYQHDIKAKHLSESLEHVVESCVNFVGVNANTGSTSLLKYVSGLGQTTARKLVEFRNTNGPFVNREQLKEVSGLGDVTFVQSAGFLRVEDGENALDRTSIHPEDYGIARTILKRLDCEIDELVIPRPVHSRPRPHVAETEAAPAKVASADAAADTGPAESTPVNTAPAEPTSAEPTPAEPTPAEPTSAEPTPAEPTPAEPTPAVDPGPEQAAMPSADAPSPPVASEPPPQEPSSQSPDAAVADPAVTDPAVTDAAVADGAGAADGAVVNREAVANTETRTEETVAPAAAVSQTSALSPAMLAEKKKRRNELVQKIKTLNPVELARELNVGEIKIRDLLRAIRNPLQDPREELPAPVFRKGILKFEDLKPGMQLRGQIVNVVDFGVFLNIGIGESCLVHISRLANRFVRDPHWLYAVGDVLNVWVQEVDAGKRRVTLTAIRPDTAKRDNRKRRSEDSHSASSTSRSRRGGKRPQGRGGKGSPAGGKGKTYQKRPPRKPRPVTPITQDMVEGKQPMRSFSDLLQFHKKKNEDDKE